MYSEIHACDLSIEAIKQLNPNATVLSGGPESISGSNGVRVPPEVFEMNIPILGICYGMQAMAEQLGGAVSPSQKREFGHARIRAHGHSSLLSGIQDDTNEAGHAYPG